MLDRIYEYELSRYHTVSFFPDAIPNEYNHIRDLTSLCITLLCSKSEEVIHILDVGGGFGTSFIELLKRCRLKNFNYSILETEYFFQFYQKKPFFRESNIAFLNSTNQITTPYQFLIFGSSLQYFKDYSQSLYDIIQGSHFPEYIMLTHTPVTLFSTFATLQINMRNLKIPRWIFNLDSLIQTFSDNNYGCVFHSSIHREGLFDDFKEDQNSYRSANFLFKKIKH